MFFLHNAGAAAFICYLNIYFMNIGLSISNIGVLAGIRPFVTFISAPLWSSLADKFGIHRWIFLGCVAAIIGIRFLIVWVKSFGFLIALTIADELFWAPTGPLMDSNAIARLGPQAGHLYGRQRLFAGS
jgi:MFS family permease